jgi:hypothetical protein
MLILSRSCCIDLRTARCLRAYWTMFNAHFAPHPAVPQPLVFATRQTSVKIGFANPSIAELDHTLESGRLELGRRKRLLQILDCIDR